MPCSLLHLSRLLVLYPRVPVRCPDRPDRPVQCGNDYLIQFIAARREALWGTGRGFP